MLSTNNIGNIGTVLFVGWSLAFEMYFYVLFAIALLLPKSVRTLFLVMFITTGAILSVLIKSPPVSSLVIFSTLPLEFLAGCIVAKLYLKGKNIAPRLAIIAITLSVISIGYVGCYGNIPTALDMARVEYFALPAIFIVYGFVSLESAQYIRFPRITLFLGDASYSIYLCHQFVLAALGKCIVAVGLAAWFPFEGWMALGIFSSLLVGSVSYKVFEKPVTNYLNNLWRHKYCVVKI